MQEMAGLLNTDETDSRDIFPENIHDLVRNIDKKQKVDESCFSFTKTGRTAFDSTQRKMFKSGMFFHEVVREDSTLHD